MEATFVYRELGGASRRYWKLLLLLGVPLALGAAAYFYIEHYGHIVTGMDNQIVWGMPHVFAVFLVVAATGALNVAIAASVFGAAAYRPMAPLSALVSLGLLVGGLAVLMLDLGRSDRMVVAVTQLNSQSVFALRVILYDGFMASVGVYLWFLLERRMNPYVKPAAVMAFIWQLLLITGTGLEFGFNFREVYDSVLYAPMFIAFSSAYGTAVFALILFAVCGWEERPVSAALLRRLKNLLGISVGASLFFAVLFLVTKYELARSREVARFLLVDGGVYTVLLWLGQLAIGGILPLALLLRTQVSRAAVTAACVLVVLGGLAQMYVTLIGGQAYPQILFPGMVESSSFFDGEVHPYTPSVPEVLLGFGSMALAAVIIAVALRALALLPERLDQAAGPQGLRPRRTSSLERRMHRFLVSAARKSSGKTSVSIGLAAELSRRGLAVQAFKKGPDYIDPMWLAAATGRSCRNLDFHLSTPEQLQLEFARHGAGADVCLVEGNKGLYDGLDLQGRNSNAALAQLLQLPVVLVLDARGMTRGIAPLILGYQAFDRAIRIVGVILSRLGGTRHEAKLRAVIEHYTDVPVLGAMQEDPLLAIAERHIGLTPAGEDAAASSRIAALAAAVARQVDLERLLAVTAGGAPLAAPPPLARPGPRCVRLGVARDRAFRFYYPDDLEALERAGAELLFFDTLRDARLPRVDGLVIGGGFPEVYMRELEANAALRNEIRAAIDAGMPAYAECGGLMYLARSLSWRGDTRNMVGVIAGDVVMHERPVGRGYVRLAPTEAHPWGNRGDGPDEIPAHEFHYSSIEGLDPRTRFAYRMARGFGVDGYSDGIVVNNLLATYSHFRSAGSYDWAARFVGFVRQCAGQRAPAATRLSAAY